MITYDYKSVESDHEKSINCLKDEVLPLLKKYWDKYEKNSGEPLSINMMSFLNMWANDGLAIVIAYDDGKPVGIFMGAKYVPFMYKANTLQVIALYGESSDITDGLFNYVMSNTKFMGLTEIIVDDKMGVMPVAWQMKEAMIAKRYTRD